MGSCPSLTNSGRVFRTAMGMGFLALLLGVFPVDAGATVYDYGVMILAGATAGGKSTEWCSPNGPTCGSVGSGLATLTHSLGESATSTLPGTNVTSSASTTTTGTAGIGDLHLSVVSKADGGIGSSGLNEEFWTDTLTIGNGFPSNTPLEFQVTLDLSGSDLAQSSGNGQGGGSSAVAFSQSNFSMSDNYGHSASNVQYICNRSMAGKGVSCGTGWESAPKSYTTVFTTDPGATIILNGLLTGETTSGGSTISYPCGSNNCYTNYAATSTADFADTSQLFIVPLNGGSFTSASGASYAPLAATFEPASFVLFGIGGVLVLLGLLRRSGGASEFPEGSEGSGRGKVWGLKPPFGLPHIRTIVF